MGVLGGGQLGRMMAQAASRLGISLTVLDPGGLGSPTGQVCGRAVEGSFTDAAKIAELAKQVDVITVEIEHVDTAPLEQLASSGAVAVHPAPSTIKLIQDKLRQKEHLRTVGGVAIGDFCDAPDAAAVRAAGARWGYPLMLKARTLAYDGRGNQPVHSEAEVDEHFGALSQGGKVKLYVERWCEFTAELAVMVVRSAADGSLASYPVVETEQRRSMCHAVIAPARISAKAAEQAQTIARAAIGSLGGGGIFGVELFAMADGSVLLNEIAPRPHNSGHYTLDACDTEQHENHLRAVLGLPLGSCAMKVGGAAMLNVIGADDGTLPTTLLPVRRAMSTPHAAVHWYGKAPPKPRRKMGHINVIGASADAAAAAMRALDDPAAASAPPPRVGVIMGSDSDLPCMRAAAEASRLAPCSRRPPPFHMTFSSHGNRRCLRSLACPSR